MSTEQPRRLSNPLPAFARTIYLPDGGVLRRGQLHPSPTMHLTIPLAEVPPPPDPKVRERLEAEWLKRYGTTTPFEPYQRPEPELP